MLNYEGVIDNENWFVVNIKKSPPKILANVLCLNDPISMELSKIHYKGDIIFPRKLSIVEHVSQFFAQIIKPICLNI
jgi:hypothetical protein